MKKYNISDEYFKSFVIDNDVLILFRLEHNELFMYLYLSNNDQVIILQQFVQSNALDRLQLHKLLQVSNNLKYMLVPNENLLCICDIEFICKNKMLKIMGNVEMNIGDKFYLTNENLICIKNKIFEARSINNLNNINKININLYNNNTISNNYFCSSNGNLLEIVNLDSFIINTFAFNHSNNLVVSDDGKMFATILNSKLRLVFNSSTFDYKIALNEKHKLFIKQKYGKYLILTFSLEYCTVDIYGFYDNKITHLDTIHLNTDNNINEIMTIQTNGTKFTFKFRDSLLFCDIGEKIDFILNKYILAIIKNSINDNNKKSHIIVNNSDTQYEFKTTEWIAKAFNHKINLKLYENYTEMVIFINDNNKEETTAVNVMTIIFDMINDYALIEPIIYKINQINHYYTILSILCQMIKNINSDFTTYIKILGLIIIYYIKKTNVKLNEDKINAYIKKLT